MNLKDRQMKGVYFALLAAVISGVSIFLNKFAVGAITPPLVFTTTKNILVGFLILGFILMTKKYKQISTLNRDQVIKLFGIGIIGGALPFYLFFTGLSLVPAVNAALLQKTLVFWVALFAIPILKERLSTRQLILIAVLFYANIFIGGFKGFSGSRGELMILAATVLWGIEHVIAKKVLKNVDPDIVVTARMFFGASMLVIAGLLTRPYAFAQVFQLSSTQWFWLLLTVATLLGYVTTWYRAIKFAPVTLVATILVGSTLVTNILSAFFVTHTINGDIFFQTTLIAIALFVFILDSRLQSSPLKQIQ